MSVTRARSGPSSVAAKPTGPLLDAAGRADVLYNRQLPASSALGKVARRIDQEWADGNIMRGVVTAVAGKTKKGATDRALKDLAAGLLVDALKATDELKPAGRMKIYAGGADAKALSAAARTVAVDGFVYTENPDNIRPVLKDIQAVLKPVGALKELRAVKAVGTVNHDELGNMRVSLYLFANPRTGEVAAFYAREGTT